MTLSDFCIRRPVFATVLSLLIIVFGATALTMIPVRELPDVDRPVVTVSTSYTGAAPEVIDSQITTTIEGAVAGISGIKTISSRSRRGSSRTVIEFNTSRNIDDAANDVRAAVARVVGNLPDAADEPRVTKSDSDDSPVMRLVISSPAMSPAEITDYADRFLIDRLSAIDGVADIQVFGERTFAIRVWLDRRALASYGLSVTELINALRENNVELPAGEIDSQSRFLQVRTDTRLSTPEDFARIVVRTVDGHTIRVGDVADVVLGVHRDDVIVRGSEGTSVVLGVLRQSQANTVQISNRVRAELDRIRPDLPEAMQLSVGSDDAIFIRGAIYEVLKTLAIAIVLVIAVIFLFLASARSTMIPAITIPIALIGACAGIAAFGFSINILTLFALILAIGIVVDDAIVVLENIQRRIDDGESPLVAAVLGSRQVQFAVIATSLTLISVFTPISFLSGSVGRLFTEFGIVLSIAVAVSTFVALSLCPVLAANLLRERRDRNRLENVIDGVLRRINSAYRASLALALRMPAVVIAISLIFAGSAAYLYGALPKELTPSEDRGFFFVSVSAPQGANLDYTDRATLDVERAVMPLIEDGSAHAITSIVGLRNQPNTAFVVVRLAHWSERDRSQAEIIRGLIPEMAQITDVRAFPIAPAGLGLRGSRNPLRVVVGGPDFADVQNWSETLRQRLQENERLLNVDTDYEENQPELSIHIDRDRARDLGVDIDVISQTLRTMFASVEATTYIDQGREYSVIAQAPREDRSRPADLTNVFVPSARTGELVPLSGFVTISENAASPELNRYSRLPSITISASLADGYDLGAAIDHVIEVAEDSLPPGAQISFSGQSAEFLETASGVGLIFVLSILIVYLVLAAQFESFVHPGVIMLSVPLAVTGALLAIWLTGGSLNIYSQVGLVLLVGLMAKNGILIVEFANQLRDQGYSVHDAALEAAVIRLRPIMMTVVSTLLGAVPLVLAFGAGAESRAAIGTVIIGGFGVASFLTLFLTPVLYNLLARFTKPRGYIEAKLAREFDRPQRPASYQPAE